MVPQGEHPLNPKLLCREKGVLGIAPALGFIFIWPPSAWNKLPNRIFHPGALPPPHRSPRQSAVSRISVRRERAHFTNLVSVAEISFWHRVV